MSTDQKLVDQFLKDFVDQIGEKFGGKIDFILLFGSAARGEFIKGASDVDLIIQLKEAKDKDAIEAEAEKIFWLLDEKYDLDFKKVLSTVASHNLAEKLFHNAEAAAHLFKPIFVFGPGELDWERGQIKAKRLDWLLASAFLVSLSTTFLKLKTEGKILYGQDIRAKIHPKISFWDKWKGIWLPFYLAVISIFVYPASPKEGLKLATKAVFWQIDAVLLYLGKQISGEKEKLKDVLKREIELTINLLNFSFKIFPEKSFEIFFQAANIRQQNFSAPYFAGWLFCFRALFFVIFTSWLANLRLILT